MIYIQTYTADVLSFIYETMTPDEMYEFVLEYGEADPEPLEYETEKEAVEDWNDLGLYVGRAEEICDGVAYRLTCNCMYKDQSLMMVSDFDLDRLNNIN